MGGGRKIGAYAWAAWAALALVGCSTNCAPGVWDLSFESAELEASARAVRIDVHAGTCAAPGPLSYSRSLVRGSMHVQPPALGPGPFALQATALDASCRRIATACTDLAASTCPAEIHQTLASAQTGPVECASCVDGLCRGSEDAGPADARVCVAHPPELCGNGVDDDCDGNADCGDEECDLLPSTCGTNPGICRGGGCCSGCWDGMQCPGGRSPHACGAGGDACVDCGSCRCNAERACEC